MSKLAGLAAFALCLVVAVAAMGQATETSTETYERVTTVRETTTVVTEKLEPKQRLTAAVFIKNKADEVLDDKVGVLEDLISAHLDDAGLRLISREDTLNAVASFADEGPNAGDEMLPGARLDAMLSNNTSATRLAQSMGADYLLIGSITTYSQSNRKVTAYGLNSHIVESRLRVTYKILDAISGGSETTGVALATKKTQAAEEQITLADVVDDLLDDAAQKIAGQLKKKIAAGRVSAPEAAPDRAGLTVTCDVADFVVPEVYVDEQGNYVVGESTYKVNAVDVTVEIDGLAIGSAPGTFKVAPGIHKIRLSREGFDDWERTINVYPGQTLRVTMRMSDEGYARWKEQAAFLERLKASSKLTDATAEKIRGYAQMLRQSGYKVDIKEDVKVDTTEGVKVTAPTGVLVPAAQHTSIWHLHEAPEDTPVEDPLDKETM